jgi:hypothetical protein
MVLDSALISIQLLGPLSASLGTRTVTLNAAKQREVLALLALNAGRIVTVSTVIEELWGDHPPRSSATTLQTYIFHLRSSLAVDTPRERVARGTRGTSLNAVPMSRSSVASREPGARRRRREIRKPSPTCWGVRLTCGAGPRWSMSGKDGSWKPRRPHLRKHDLACSNAVSRPTWPCTGTATYWGN